MNATLITVSILGPEIRQRVRVIKRGPKRALIEALKRTALPGRYIEKGTCVLVPAEALKL